MVSGVTAESGNSGGSVRQQKYVHVDVDFKSMHLHHCVNTLSTNQLIASSSPG